MMAHIHTCVLWDFIVSLSASEVSAIASVVSAIASSGLLILAIFAGRTATQTLRASEEASEAAREANIQAKNDSIAQTRPYVYVEFVPGIMCERSLDLRIVNVGRSSARKLTLEFVDTAESANRSEISEIQPWVRELFQTPRTLPPSCSIRTLWCNLDEEGSVTSSSERKSEGMPLEGTIHLKYCSDDGTEYSDEFEVLFWKSGLSPVPEKGSKFATRHDFYVVAQAISRAISYRNW